MVDEHKRSTTREGTKETRAQAARAQEEHHLWADNGDLDTSCSALVSLPYSTLPGWMCAKHAEGMAVLYLEG